MISAMKKILCFVLLSALTLLSGAPEKVYKDSELNLITRLTAYILHRNHYRPQKMDVTLSKKFFEEYFDTLDPQRIYFTQQDVKHFAKYKPTLSLSLLQGNTAFAFSLYALYRQRLAEFIRFAEQECAKKNRLFRR